MYYGNPATASADRDPRDEEVFSHTAVERRMVVPEGTLYTPPVLDPDAVVRILAFPFPRIER